MMLDIDLLAGGDLLALLEPNRMVGWMNGQIIGWKNGWMDRCMNGWLHGQMWLLEESLSVFADHLASWWEVEGDLLAVLEPNKMVGQMDGLIVGWIVGQVVGWIVGWIVVQMVAWFCG